jgi:hypothetical protein
MDSKDQLTEPTGRSNHSLTWETRNLFIHVQESLEPGSPPLKIDLASTLGATSDLPLAIRKVCRYWFDPSIRTKVDVVRYINAISTQNGFKIATLSNSKQGLDRRAQLVCSRGIVARKPRGKSEHVQTTTARPIKTEERCPFSITVYECRNSGRWYVRKYGNGNRMHCGHCRLPPEQVGIRRFQSLTERIGEDWSDEKLEGSNSSNVPLTSPNSFGEKLSMGKRIEAALTAQGRLQFGLDLRSEDILAQESARAQAINILNNTLQASIPTSHHNTGRNDKASLQQLVELRRLQQMLAPRNGIGLNGSGLLLQGQSSLISDHLCRRAVANYNLQLQLQSQLGVLPHTIGTESIGAGLLGNRLLAGQSQLLGISNNASEVISRAISSDMSRVAQQIEINNLSKFLNGGNAGRGVSGDGSISDGIFGMVATPGLNSGLRRVNNHGVNSQAATMAEVLRLSNAIETKMNRLGYPGESGKRKKPSINMAADGRNPTDDDQFVGSIVTFESNSATPSAAETNCSGSSEEAGAKIKREDDQHSDVTRSIKRLKRDRDEQLPGT